MADSKPWNHPLSTPLITLPIANTSILPMAEQHSDRRNSNSQLLQELDALSQTLYQSHTARRAASLVIPRSAGPIVGPVPTVTADASTPVSDHYRPRSRRMSMSLFRSRPKPHELDDGDTDTSKSRNKSPATVAAAGEKKSIWNWKPMRALSHIGMQRLSCLFSVEVVTVHGLPPSMNSLCISVAVRKKETKEGTVRTMPARVLDGTADIEETLFIRCHVYCSGKPLKFEPRPFFVYALAVDAPELDFGRSTVDLSRLVQESMERNLEGIRIRQWDTAFPLTGKAKGGELVVKLGFQIMDDGGVGIYNQTGMMKESRNVARMQSKSSFSVASPRISNVAIDLKGIDDFNLDGPATQKVEPELKGDDLDLPEFDVIDQGVEIEEKEKENDKVKVSVSSEVVKEVVHNSAHLVKLTELDAIANQIKALESMVITDETDTKEEDGNQRLDAQEESMTREFLQMLKLEDDKEPNFDMPQRNLRAEGEAKSFLSDLGEGLGSVVQTRDGGYLASMNPFDIEVPRKETPKLAMQLSKPILLKNQRFASGIEVFQKLAAMGLEELSSKLLSLTAMDELMGKTAEQIAFEGMASIIISKRTKEGESFSAASSVAALKTMAAAMNEGRKERVLAGIWNVKEEPVEMEEILSFSLQKIEGMSVEALKIQADMTDEEPPFDVSPHVEKESILDSTLLPEDSGANEVTMVIVVQLRDPLRRYEAVGAPAIAVVQAQQAADEARFKVSSLHVGGMKMRSSEKKSNWDGEKQRLTAKQWLVAYGLAKAGKKNDAPKKNGGPDSVWSISSRVMADMWLKSMRNPDVKFADKL